MQSIVFKGSSKLSRFSDESSKSMKQAWYFVAARVAYKKHLSAFGELDSCISLEWLFILHKTVQSLGNLGYRELELNQNTT